MRKITGIKSLFVDIGGVLLTDGFGHQSRKLAAKAFNLELDEINSRHNIVLDAYELGELTIDEYLGRVVFYKKRPFTRVQFQKFIFAQSKPYPEMIELVRRVKTRYGLKIVVVSNEARELNLHRIQTFRLDDFVDLFISSCFVHLRKLDADIYRMALDVAQVPADQVVYIENLPKLVQVAEDLGIRSICHTGYKATCTKLASFGLYNEERSIHGNS